MSTCPTCGESFRKGRRTSVITDAGDIVVRLVCPRCAKRAVKIVASTRAKLCNLCPPGETREATACSSCLNKCAHSAVVASWQPLVERLRGAAKAYRLNGDPLATGLEMAADIIMAGGRG